MSAAATSSATAKVTRVSDYDADGRAEFRVEWDDCGKPESMRWTGTVAELALALARNWLRAVRS